MGIQCFGTEFLALLQHEFIKVGQDGRVEPDTVFHYQNHLYTDFVYIVFQVHFILYQFDDRHQQIGISQPTEDIFEGTQVFIGNTLGDAVTERSQYHHGDMLVQALDVACYIETVVISRTRHADDEVERYGGKLCQRFFTGGCLGKTWWIAQGERCVFVKDFFIYTSVVFQHESIIGVGYQKNVENAARHQVGELRIFKIKLV